MRTIAEVLDAAAQFSEAELAELSREIVRLERQSRALLLDLKGLSCRLIRLNDGELLEVLPRSLAIESDYGFELRIILALQETERALNFAQVYLALKSLSGESSRHFDDYKGAFSFPFALDILRERRELPYLLIVRNRRDSLYFDVRKVVAADDERLPEHRVYPPFTEEFSRDEINQFFTYFYGFLMGTWKSMRRQDHEPFLRKVPSDLILFGCCDGETFEEQFDSQEAYQAACKTYERREKVEQTDGPQPDPCSIRPVTRDS